MPDYKWKLHETANCKGKNLYNRKGTKHSMLIYIFNTLIVFTKRPL